MSEAVAGKKIFFLYPPSVIQEELVSFLLRNEYEVYFLKDHLKAGRIFKRFENVICFINIDNGLKESEWEGYIKNLRSDPEVKGLQIGILSYNNDPGLIQKYLMEIGVECGFIRLKLGLKQSTDIILKVLEVNEAKGRRKYVRVNCENIRNVEMNFTHTDSSYTSQILDISSVGCACKFSEEVPIENKTIIHEVQLNLKGILIQTDCIILGRRSDNPKILIFIFNPGLKENEREKVHEFLHKTLQNTMSIY